MTVKTDDVTKGRKDPDPHGRLRAVTGGSGANGLTKNVSVLTTIIFGEVSSMTVKQTNKSIIVHAIRNAKWNLDITNLFITKSSVKQTSFFFLLFNPVIVKDMKKNVDITKPRYSKQILPVPWVISRFHCRTATYQF